MRKHLFCILLPLFFYLSSFCQFTKESEDLLYAKIDSLKKVAPKLSGRERLALLNKENNFNTFYKIEDVVNVNNEVTGTKVQLKIRHKETIEEYA